MHEWLFERLANMASDGFYASSITGARSSINEFAGTEALWAVSFAGSLDEAVAERRKHGERTLYW